MMLLSSFHQMILKKILNAMQKLSKLMKIIMLQNMSNRCIMVLHKTQRICFADLKGKLGENPTRSRRRNG